MVWEAIFLLAVLKIPVIYVCCVAWWAIRAEPRPYDGLEPALDRTAGEPTRGPARDSGDARVVRVAGGRTAIRCARPRAAPPTRTLE